MRRSLGAPRLLARKAALDYLSAVFVASAPSTPSGNAIVGLIIIGVFLAVVAALVAALLRARVRLARAETELSFLRGASQPYPAPGQGPAWYAPPAPPNAPPLPDPERP